MKRSPTSPYKFFAFAVFMAAALLGCGSPAKDPIKAGPETIPVDSLKQAQELAQKAVAGCADLANCPESIGFLTTTDSSQVFQCTSFLIGDRYAMTNSHCIPKDLKTAGSSCADRIWMTFPDTPSRPTEKIRCKTVLVASSIADMNPGVPVQISADYAIFELESPTSRRPLPISREGMADQLALQVPKMDPIAHQSVPTGRLTVKDCSVVQQTLEMPEFTDVLNPVGTVDCAIIHGNSGSPMLSSDGKVRAIVFAEYSSTADDLKARGYTALDSTFDEIGLATNTACLALPSAVGASQPADCKWPSHLQTSGELSAKVSAAAQSDLDRQAKLWAESLGADFRALHWIASIVDHVGDHAFTNSGASSAAGSVDRLIPLPGCVLNAETIDSIAAGAPPVVASVPVYEWTRGLNLKRQFDYRISKLDSLEAQISMGFDTSTWATEHQLLTTSRTSVGTGVFQSQDARKISACPN